MAKFKTTLKGFGYFGLALFTIYALFISDNKNLSWYALIAMGVVYYYWLNEEWQARKDREERRLQGLFDRVHYLEQEIKKMDYDHLDLQARVEEIEGDRSEA